MHLKASLSKRLVFIIAGLTTLLLISIAFARGPIRVVNGTVTKVSDGDTIHVTTPEQTKLKVRLYGIDAPETPKINHRTGHVNKPGQPYGKESWKALEHKIMGKQVSLDIIELDRYRRMVSMVWINERNINLEMIREGHAEAYIEYLREPYKPQFMTAQQEAQLKKIGIWSFSEYERPSDFKRRLKVRGE